MLVPSNSAYTETPGHECVGAVGTLKSHLPKYCMFGSLAGTMFVEYDRLQKTMSNTAADIKMYKLLIYPPF